MKKGQRAGAGKWQRREMQLAEVGAVMRQRGFSMDPSDPVEAYGLVDRLGRPRRVHARYADGWRVTLVCYLDGTASLSFAMRFSGRIEAQAAA